MIAIEAKLLAVSVRHALMHLRDGKPDLARVVLQQAERDIAQDERRERVVACK